MRLGLALGKSIREIEQLDGDELQEWKAFFATEPMVDHYWIGAQICVVLARTMGGDKKAKIEDFLPVRRRKKAAPDQAEAALRAALGG